LDCPVEVHVTSATCSSQFSFRDKPGLTRIDHEVMRGK